MNQSKFLLATSIFATSNILSKDVKLGIFSDIHLNMNYNPDSSDNFCTNTNQSSHQIYN